MQHPNLTRHHSRRLTLSLVTLALSAAAAAMAEPVWFAITAMTSAMLIFTAGRGKYSPYRVVVYPCISLGMSLLYLFTPAIELMEMDSGGQWAYVSVCWLFLLLALLAILER